MTIRTVTTEPTTLDVELIQIIQMEKIVIKSKSFRKTKKLLFG